MFVHSVSLKRNKRLPTQPVSFPPSCVCALARVPIQNSALPIPSMTCHVLVYNPSRICSAQYFCYHGYSYDSTTPRRTRHHCSPPAYRNWSSSCVP